MNKLELDNLVKVESSNIDLVGFDGHTTYVQFKNGGIYSYPKTTEQEYLSLINAKSVGKTFNVGFKQKGFLKLEDTVLAVKPTKTMIEVNEQERLFIAHCMSEWFNQCGGTNQPQWQLDLYERIYGEKFHVIADVSFEKIDVDRKLWAKKANEILNGNAEKPKFTDGVDAANELLNKMEASNPLKAVEGESEILTTEED